MQTSPVVDFNAYKYLHSNNHSLVIGVFSESIIPYLCTFHLNSQDRYCREASIYCRSDRVHIDGHIIKSKCIL